MTLVTDFAGPDYVKLFLGAIVGFIIGFLFSPHHQDKASRTKAGIYEIIGVLAGILVAYIWISYNK